MRPVLKTFGRGDIGASGVNLSAVLQSFPKESCILTRNGDGDDSSNEVGAIAFKEQRSEAVCLNQGDSLPNTPKEFK